jgi:hypothetical protein
MFFGGYVVTENEYRSSNKVKIRDRKKIIIEKILMDKLNLNFYSKKN